MAYTYEKQVLWKHHEDLVIYPWKYYELQEYHLCVVKVPWKLHIHPWKPNYFLY